MNKEAIKLAIKTLLWANEEINGWRDDAYGHDPVDHPEIMLAIKALEEALKQEQEIETLKRCLFQMQEAAKDLVQQAQALAKQEQELALQKLHDENERLGLYKDAYENQKHLYVIGIDGVPKGVRVHSVYPGMKLYAHPQQKQEQGEPVAYWNFNSGLSHCMIDQLNEAAKHNPAPLYTTPQQRTWVGLTDEEMKKTWYEMQNIMGWYSFQEISKSIEAKLKEKNT